MTKLMYVSLEKVETHGHARRIIGEKIMRMKRMSIVFCPPGWI